MIEQTESIPVQEQELDLNAIARPEGAEAIPTLKQPENEQNQESTQEGQEGEVSAPIPEGQDITQQIAAEQSRAGTDNGGEERETIKQGDENIRDSSEPSGEVNRPEGSEVDYYNQLFDSLETRLGKDNVQRPEALTEENALDELARVFYENADWSESFDPRVMAIQEQIESGVPFEKAVSPHTAHSEWNSLSNEQKVRQYLEHGLEMKPEEVESEIKNMNVNVEAKKLDKQREHQVEEYTNYSRQQQEIENQQMHEARGNAFKETVGEFNKNDEIWGIPVTAKQRQEFPDKLSKLITPTNQGNAPIVDMLNNNELLMKLAFFIEYGEPGIKDLLHTAKSDIKNQMKAKLDPEPNFPKTSRNKDPQKIDVNALMSPARD